jgi:hypothetical protein
MQRGRDARGDRAPLRHEPAWHAGQKEVTVQLADRIVMSPFVAKRLVLMLGNILKDYESK